MQITESKVLLATGEDVEEPLGEFQAANEVVAAPEITATSMQGAAASGAAEAKEAQAVARSLLSSRIIAVYPDSAVVTITNALGEDYETLVDGTFIAAALAEASVSPAVDVATPYTRRRVLGFTRLPPVIQDS